ncbi:hypothetical protein HR45_11305 [Shewanella mangrovi]|uniref:SnoaL-like domain-containing protein n=1 Tax=Shewanella mangrovi TaxID=1515746 RepID=A0A094LQ38_9GAMM|nr:nuclear transport factor 2 family protein [Shewanella mangrovi]KFZ37258.1 hypothetical protein HR45_11305 [Shewanella mangrovi]
MSNQIEHQRISALLDREEIRILRQHYSELLDGNNAERMDEVFTEDAEVVVTVGSMKGIAAIKQSLADAYQQFDTQQRAHFPFVHAITNHNIIITGENSATGSCYLLDLVTDRPSAQHPFLLVGRYQDEYARVNGEWRIAKTALDVVWPHAESDK